MKVLIAMIDTGSRFGSVLAEPGIKDTKVLFWIMSYLRITLSHKEVLP
jgi:hypothetical protein